MPLPRRGERHQAAATAQRRLALLAGELTRRQPSVTDQARSGAARDLDRDLEPDRNLEPDRDVDLDPGPADPWSGGVDGAPGDAVSARHRAPSLSRGHRARSAVGDLLPAPAQRLRAERRVEAQHVTVVALVVVALVALGAWWLLAGRPGPPEAVAPMATPGGVIETSPPGPLPSGTGIAPPPTDAPVDETVVVDVAGKVRSAGLVTLPVGARVADALESAGGARPGVDLVSLNLARVLVDGEQILVGVDAAPVPPSVPGATGPTSPTAPPVAGLVDVNTATLEQLDTLPGIGPVTGQAILDWRASNGAFTSVDELLEVDGIGDATLADIRDLVTV